MRWLFLLLLLLNAAYVGWELNREPASVPDVSTPVAGLQRIVLLRELEDGESRSKVMQHTKENASTSQEANESSTRTSIIKAEKAASDAVADTADSRELASEKSAVESPVQHTEAQPDQTADEDRCYTLGPFRELDRLSALTQAIKNHVVETGFRSREEQEQPMFWVYLESAGSMSKARELSKELDSKKIKDYFILSSGDHKYGISLGIFREKERAYRHEKRVRALGFEPKIEPVFRTHTIYWLDYRMKAGDSIPTQVFKDHLPESVNRLDRSCQP